MRASLTDPLPLGLGVGAGTALFLHGDFEDPDLAWPRLWISAQEHGPRVAARRAGAEWWGILPIRPVRDPTRAELRLEAETAAGATKSIPLGEIELTAAGSSDEAVPTPPSWDEDAGERVAICMGTYDPPPDLFERQIRSIREQSHGNWLCVISDDSSSVERLEAIREILGDDPRFVLRPSEERLGFYANFERALRLAPTGATHIALADQDDRWEPDRLATLLDALKLEDILVYSDMRIVAADGGVISETYWRHRRNNWTDLGTLLIGNTITGAASLFRRSLLDRALPFPPRVGGAYHDHWLALAALASGSVRYVDRALHDYVQHPDAVIGFSSANADRGGAAPGDLLARGRRLASRLIRPDGRRRYFDDYARIALLATVLELRCGELMGPEKRAEVNAIRELEDSGRGALALAMRSLAPRNPTMGVDRSVLAGITWSRLARRRARPRPQSAVSPRISRR